jgi:eukaryotic-like serine/threonine-protein kinase
VILFELLTGLLPFEENATGPQIAHFLNDPIPINERREGLTFPPELWQVLSRALQKLPEDRFSTAMEFAEALKPFNTANLSLAPPAARKTAPATQSTPPPSSAPVPLTQQKAAADPPPRTPVPPPQTPLPPSHTTGRVRTMSQRHPPVNLISHRTSHTKKPSRTPLVVGIIAALVLIAAVVYMLVLKR